MASLKQNSTSPTSYYGWYGICDQTDCDLSFDLQSEPNIIGAAGRDGESEISYYRENILFSRIKELKCGQAYKITIAKGIGDVNIPDFTIFDDSSSSPILITNCNGDSIQSSSLKQNSTSPTSYYGWYGVCNQTNCNSSFNLQSEPRIIGAVGRDGESEISYYRENILFSRIKELECGQAYKIIVEPGQDEVIIPNFITSDVSNINNSQITTTICDNSDQPNNEIQTPTPTPKSTPTPTPKKISAPIQNTSTILKIPVILVMWDGSSDPLTFGSHDLDLGTRDNSDFKTATKSDLENYLNSENYSWPKANTNDRPTGSVKEYFKSISFGQLEVQFKIVPAGSNPNPNSNNLDEYAYDISEIDEGYKDWIKLGGGGTQSSGKFSKIATNIVLKAKRNYLKLGKKFDKANENGEFDVDLDIVFFHAGLGNEDYKIEPQNDNTGFIHSHRSRFDDFFINDEGKTKGASKKRPYTIQPFRKLYRQKNNDISTMLSENCTITTIGTTTHESGHSFDIRDQYDKQAGGLGAGDLPLMSSGRFGVAPKDQNSKDKRSGHLPSFATSFAREQIASKGYFSINKINEYKNSQKNIEIYPVTERNEIHKIYHPTEPDVWYIEYRSNSTDPNKKTDYINYDKLLAKSGLAIFHVPDKDQKKQPKKHLEIPLHRRGESGYFISVESNKKPFNLERNKTVNDASEHLFQDGDEFSPFTYPSTVSRNGVPSGIRIHNIRTTNNGTKMLFDLDFLNESNKKIVSIEYSWQEDGTNETTSTYDIRLSKRKQNESHTITVTTENIPDGTEINLQINNQSDEVITGDIQKNQCVFTIIPNNYNLEFLQNYPIKKTGDNPHKSVGLTEVGTPNYFRYYVDSSENIFSWTDVVMGVD